jgi:hypothetical protein
MSGGLYVKLQADYSDDPKIIRAGEAAEVLYVRMLCFCARTLSDGLVDDAQMTRLALRQLPKRVARLLEEHLVERVEGGYKIVSWHKHNRSAASIAEERDKKSSGSNHANHLRWHVQMGRFVAECVWCQADRQPPSSPSDKGSDKGSDIGSDVPHLWDSIDPSSDPALDPALAPASSSSSSDADERQEPVDPEVGLSPDDDDDERDFFQETKNAIAANRWATECNFGRITNPDGRAKWLATTVANIGPETVGMISETRAMNSTLSPEAVADLISPVRDPSVRRDANRQDRVIDELYRPIVIDIPPAPTDEGRSASKALQAERRALKVADQREAVAS